MTEYLTPDDLVVIAQGAVGPEVAVRDVGLLASAAARPQATVFGEDAYPSLADKAAALLLSLVRNHALIDGNKRLGWAACVVFCELNDVDLNPVDHDAAFDLVMSIADGSTTEVATVAHVLEAWFSPLQ